MEGVSTRLYSGLKGYWRRRGYQKLNRKNRVDLSTEGSTRKRKFWKIKLTPRLKLKINFKRFSLKKLLIGLRDAYVNAMLRVANTRGFSGDYGGGIDGFGMRRVREYDEKVLVEIYKSMIIAQGKLAPREVTAKIGPEINVNGNGDFMVIRRLAAKWCGSMIEEERKTKGDEGETVIKIYI